MKVIHFVTSIDCSLGGVSTYMQLLSKELGKFVNLIVVTCPSDNPLKLENCQVKYLPSSLLELHKFKKQWINILQTESPDIVHINGIWMIQTWIAQREALRFGISTYITPHGMLEPWIIQRHYYSKKLPALWLYQKKAIRTANCLHATSDSEKEHLLNLGYNDHIAMIPNGIAIEDIAIKTSWKRKKTILYLSRIHVKKGVNFLIEAVAALKNELKEYTINIAGEGDTQYINKLKKQISLHGISSNIQFIGGIYGEKKWKAVREADLFVLPTYSESFGIAITEALACGTPVITTKGAPWEELDTWHCGWWTEIGTEPLREALLDFLNLSESNLETMGRNGRRLIEEKYSSKKMAEDMFTLYKKTTNKDERTN